MSDIPEHVINGMCMTWRHDFGLVRPDGDDGGDLGVGITEQERESLRNSMRQLWEHNIKPYVQAALDNAASLSEENARLRRELDEAKHDVARYRFRHGNMDSRW